MINLMFILINMVLVLIYWKYPKKMHPMQAASHFMITVLYTHDFLVIPIVNLEYWTITKRMDYGLIITLNAMIAVPTGVLLFMEKYLIAYSVLQRVIIFVVWTAAMLLFEYVHHWFGYIIHKNWEILWSVAIWSILGGLIVICNKFISNMIMKIGESR